MKLIKIFASITFSLFCYAAIAQDSIRQQHKVKQHKAAIKKMYCCPMDKEVRSDMPGKCPKCGMDLSLSKTEKMKAMKTYACPMHPEQASKKSGKCPKCGMDLTQKKE